MKTTRRALLKKLSPLLLCVGITSAGPDASPREAPPPPPGDPRVTWNAHLEDSKKESQAWITSRNFHTEGPFYYQGRSIIYRNDDLVKLRYYFIVAQGSTAWAETSREYQENGTVTHALEYDLKTARWRTFDPRVPWDGPSEPEQPFTLHQAKGQAHPILTGAARWELDRGIFFDAQHHTDVHTFTKDAVLVSEIIRNPWDEKIAPMTRFKGREFHHAWEGIMQIGDVTQTYAIDPAHKAMMFSTLQPVDDHTWFWGHRYLRHVRECLYEFDRSPFQHPTGKVTITSREGSPPMGDPVEQRKVTAEFQTTKTTVEGDKPHTLWRIAFKGTPHDELTRTVWDDGPDFFARRESNHNFRVWQAKEK